MGSRQKMRALNRNRNASITVPGNATRLLRVTVAVALLYYVFSHIGLEVVFTAISRANTLVLLSAYGVAIIVEFVASYRLKRLTDVQGLDLPTPIVFEVNLATRFYGLFLPGGNLTALLIRIFKLTKERSQIAGVAVSLFADRVITTLSLCILGLLFWVLAQPHPSGSWLLVFVPATAGCAILSYLLFAQSFSQKRGRIASLLQRLSPVQWARLTEVSERFRQAGRKILVRALMLSVSAHLISTVGCWLVAQSLDVELSLVTIAWVRSGMLLVTLLPITIAGLGVREVAALALLQHYGVEPGIAVGYSLLVFAATVVGIGLLGGITEVWRFASGGGASHNSN